MLKKRLSYLRDKHVLGCWIIYLLLFSLIPINVLGYDASYENRGGNIVNLHPGDSIDEAVVNAMDGDTILLDGGDYKTSSGIIAKNITLKASGVGGNPILSKKSNKDTIITLSGANFKLEGLTINGCNVSNGIMIRNQANAIINNCNITNTTNSVGGGVYVSLSNAIISGCNVVDNRVSGSGSGAGVYIDNYDGRSVYNVSINHCRLYNNKVSNNNSDSYDDVFVRELYDMDGNSLKASINLDHNWWGSNTVNSTQTNVVPNDHYSTALYLNNNITTTNASVGFTDGNDVTIGYDLVLNTTNRTDNNSLLPYFSVKHNYINESIIKDGREPYNISFKAKYLANQSFESVVDNQGLKIIIFSNIVDSIQELIDEAEPNTVIELPDGIYNKGSKDDFIRDCNLIINKPLTIKAKDDGHPVIDLTGKNTNGFKILSNNVRLDGLTVKCADFNGDGGAILSLGGDNTVIKNCTLANNKVWGGGGGIAILNGNNVTIDNCNVVNNTAGDGAGIHMRGGCINNVITNSNVLNNKATNFGGGICLLPPTFVNITSSNIINNSAWRGGGFFISSTDVSNVNYNRILNNKNSWFEEGEDFYGEGLVNLDFNWWGTNDLTTKQTNHIPEHYFIVNSSINKSNNALNYVFNTNDNYPNNRSLFPYFDGFCILNDKNFSFDARDNQIFDLNQRNNVSIKVDNYEYNYTDPFESLSDIYVAFNGSNNNLGGINNPVADVNYAMNLVKPNGTIHLLTNLSITETINVTKNLKIKSDKEKLKLNGLNKTKIMNIVPGLTVNIESLHFINGFGLDGAGITNNESNLNINDCVFENNNVSGFGGAIVSLYDYNKSTSNQIFTNQFRSKSHSNQFNFRSSDYGRKLSTAHPTQENYLTISNSSFIKNNAYKGSAILIMSPEFNMSYSNFTNNSLSQNTEVIVGINKKFNIANSSMLENSLDNIKEDDRIYVNTNLFLLDSTLNKGRDFIQGFVHISQKSIDEYKKEGYFKAHIGDNGHYMKCYNLDNNVSAGDLVLVTSQDEVNLTQDIPTEHPGMWTGIGTGIGVLGLAIIGILLYCICDGFANLVGAISTWMGQHKILSKIILSIVSAGVGALVTWLVNDKFTGEESLSTVTYVEMPEEVYIGQVIYVKIKVTTTDGNNVTDGNYKVKINNEEKILHFENGETSVSYNVSRYTNNFVVEFTKNQYRQVDSRKYYYDYSRCEPQVHYNKFNTTMEASSNVSSCRYNDTIDIRFITSAGILVSGNYIVGVKEYTQDNYEYYNISFVNGVGHYNYTIKTRNWGWYPLRIDCIFNDSDLYFGSESYFMIDFDMSLNGLFNKYNHSFFARRSYIP
ncbi:MAG: right-handed parallel beta-helix repeat-containing protein [Methanobrevibacter sp.]|jgi:hypothetical protein|nr:right-handed parallel beta-helix repeat-containing protein [Methanobrevibacter sp.]